MHYSTSPFSSALAQVLDQDAELLSELRDALVENAETLVDLLARSRCDANWLMAAQRLKGLAASFGAEELMRSAQAAINAVPGDPGVLRRVQRSVAMLRD